MKIKLTTAQGEELTSFLPEESSSYSFFTETSENTKEDDTFFANLKHLITTIETVSNKQTKENI